MNWQRQIIRRPIACILLAIAFMLAGLTSWFLLPVAPFPQVDYPVIVVTATMPGTEPTEMAKTVTTPLERALGNINGINQIRSISSANSAIIFLMFNIGQNQNDAAREVQAAINTARPMLPSGMPTSPTYQKVNSEDVPILVLVLTSKNKKQAELYDFAQNILARKISQISGVGSVKVEGAQLPAVRIQIHPEALSHLGISLEHVRQVIAQADPTQPLGIVENEQYRWDIQLGPRLTKAKDFESLIIQYRHGQALRLKDVASVTDSIEDRYTRGFYNYQPAVFLSIIKRQNANIVQTNDEIQKEMPFFKSLLPSGADLEIVMDFSQDIRASLHEAQITLLLSIALVIFVVWLFMGDLKTAIIPCLSIPISLIGSLSILWLAGYSINNITLMALILAAGLVIDDSIVVLENIERHLALGTHPFKAAVRGMREVGFTLIAINLSLIVIFCSILFMGDLFSMVFGEFSLALISSILISLFVSLTLTPSLCAFLLHKHHQPKASERFKRWYKHLEQRYMRNLIWLLKHKLFIVVLTIAIGVLNVFLFSVVPKSALPHLDTGFLEGYIRGDNTASFQAMLPKIDTYRDYILKDPDVKGLLASQDSYGGLANAWLLALLKPKGQRHSTSEEIQMRLRRHAPEVPGGLLSFRVYQSINLSPPPMFSRRNNELLLMSDDMKQLDHWGKLLDRRLKKSPELTDIQSDSEGSTQKLYLNINREKIQRLGLDIKDIGNLLNNSLSQRQIVTLYERYNQYHIVMEISPRLSENPNSLKDLEIIDKNGKRIPLSNFIDFHTTSVKDRVRHYQQFATFSFSYNVANGYTATQAQQAIDNAINELMIPSTIQKHYSGDSADLNAVITAMITAFIILFISIYVVLGILYESLFHPLTILSSLPSAGIGAILALIIGQSEFSLISLLGMFLLIGLVMKNAILMVDFALAVERKRKLRPIEAICLAAKTRLRPIIMTNMATLFGAIPLVLALGAGSELRKPLGLTIIGGIILSQLLTLYITPAFYLFFDTLRIGFINLIKKYRTQFINNKNLSKNR